MAGHALIERKGSLERSPCRPCLHSLSQSKVRTCDGSCSKNPGGIRSLKGVDLECAPLKEARATCVCHSRGGRSQGQVLKLVISCRGPLSVWSTMNHLPGERSGQPGWCRLRSVMSSTKKRHISTRSLPRPGANKIEGRGRFYYTLAFLVFNSTLVLCLSSLASRCWTATRPAFHTGHEDFAAVPA